jgi:hypothetical protein
MSTGLTFRAGDWIEIRSKEEILQTLDKKGQLEGLPFMPQMFQYCGQHFQVFKRAHKTCDTVNGSAGLRMNNAVHLEGIRCDGQAYGGCQAGCLVFWKTAWLKGAPNNHGGTAVRASDPQTGNTVSQASGFPSATVERGSGECTEGDVWAGTKGNPDDKSDDPTYVCQITQLPMATTPLSPWDVTQYVEDYTSRNVGLSTILSGFLYATYNRIINLGIGVGPVMRWLYDTFQAIRGGAPYPRRWGTIPEGQPTPSASLDLKPGELVRVKSYKQILQTLTTSNRNRGLFFDAEMVPFCGKTYRVRSRVSKILNEKSGKMMKMKNDCIVLEDVFCQACYSEQRYFCPRAIYSYWREVWLERVSNNGTG